jgi:hypothetical protein
VSVRCLAAIKFPDETQVTPSRKDTYDDSDHNEHGAEPQRQSVSFLGGTVLNEVNLLQEQTESSDDETEAHHRESGADPCEQGALRGEIVAKARLLRVFSPSVQSSLGPCAH